MKNAGCEVKKKEQKIEQQSEKKSYLNEKKLKMKQVLRVRRRSKCLQTVI